MYRDIAAVVASLAAPTRHDELVVIVVIVLADSPCHPLLDCSKRMNRAKFSRMVNTS